MGKQSSTSVEIPNYDYARFPYRQQPGETVQQLNARISNVLTSVDNMLYELVRSHGEIGLNDHDVEDIVQKTREHLWLTVLPKFDITMDAKVSTFLCKCAYNFINSQLRTRARQSRSWRALSYVDQSYLQEIPEATSEILDDQVESLADDIMNNPEKYFNPRQVKAFRAVINNRNKTMRQIAMDLNLRRPSALSMILHRIKVKITQQDIESYAKKTDSQYTTGRIAAELVSSQIDPTGRIQPTRSGMDSIQTDENCSITEERISARRIETDGQSMSIQRKIKRRNYKVSRKSTSENTEYE